MNKEEYYTLECTRPKTLQIDCDIITLKERTTDLTINIPTEKIERFDYLILNGIKFINLNSIKDAKPSEALKSLEFICKILKEKSIDIKWLFTNDYNIIKQYILKAQENEKVFLEREMQLLYDKNFLKEENAKYKKVLEIIKEKDVDFYSLRRCDTVDEHNAMFTIDEFQKLTQEEFNLLKEVLEND